MRMTQQLMMPLFKDMNLVHIACLFFRIRCHAHRLCEFGFERFTNEFSAIELLALACLMPHFQHDRLIEEAYAKGDSEVRVWIETHFMPLVMGIAVTEAGHGN